MAVTHSKMIELGMKAPPFDLPTANPGVDEVEGETRALADYAEAEAAVVVFTCNHCPYAKHVEDALVDMASHYQARGVQFIAINANDPEQYPEDAFDKMAERAKAKQFPFPYLFDASQDVAKAYGALCTPDFFVFDDDRTLAYRGRFDETRPNQGEAHGGDLSAALDELLQQGEVTSEQHPSMGCNIKWKPGNAPA
ncbi:MAG: redoxin domain-containing protein [Bacteroidetes bacterium]|jgi:peroxiredoxin|nr:redoxin domain-containing protein [Bacteroidota bacterium]